MILNFEITDNKRAFAQKDGRSARQTLLATQRKV